MEDDSVVAASCVNDLPVHRYQQHIIAGTDVKAVAAKSVEHKQIIAGLRQIGAADNLVRHVLDDNVGATNSRRAFVEDWVRRRTQNIRQAPVFA